MLPLPVRNIAKPNAEINIVPYIDVMLVLLVIFMITTPILEQGVELDLPVAKSEVFDGDWWKDSEPVIISVKKTGAYSIDGDNLNLSGIVHRVLAAQSIDPKAQVMVRGDKEVAYGEVIKLINSLQKDAGVQKVGFVTEAFDQQ